MKKRLDVRILELEARVDYLEKQIDAIMAAVSDVRDYVLKLELDEDPKAPTANR